MALFKVTFTTTEVMTIERPDLGAAIYRAEQIANGARQHFHHGEKLEVSVSEVTVKCPVCGMKPTTHEPARCPEVR